MIDVVAQYNIRAGCSRCPSSNLADGAKPPGARSGQIILERDVLQVADVAAEPNYTFANTSQAVLGIRTFLGVPMLRQRTAELVRSAFIVAR